MSKKKAKKQGLKAESKRQADDALRGYLYQIWHSVNAWLDLTEDEILYLEGAEDFDRVSDGSATAVQVKNTQHKITLRSQEVNDAINHYWKLRNDHPDLCVKFRFLTRSKIGKERGNPFGEDQAGLHLWSRCSGDEKAIKKIVEFLQAEGKVSGDVDNFLKQAESEIIYEQLIESITWETDSKEASFVEKSITKKLILHGDRYGIPPSDSSKVVDHLLIEAFTVATQKKNRELTRVRFLEIFEEKTTQRIPISHSRYMQIHPTMMDAVGSALIENPSDITIRSQSPIQNSIPPLYSDFAPRTELVESIQNRLQLEGLTVIQGGTGMGKTTLAKLTANAINGSWFWINFTKRDPSQVVQLLQQLAIAISNQSSKINIVLDDLNLQPRQLRQYEEILGVVVYRVLEYGAKLSITSQHDLPNDVIRRLGVSPSVVIHIPSFTVHEIEQFAQQLGCHADQAEAWAKLIQLHTSGHPRLVHARLTRLRAKDWKEDENIFQTPQEVVEEREEARQLLIDLSEDQRELLYRLSLMSIRFRRDYALNIGDIPESISYPGDTFSQLIGPWIDPVSETYYTISPLLNNAANQVWPESKINDLHAQIANAILKTKNLTAIEVQAVLLHSIIGQNEEGLIAVVHALMATSENLWKQCSQEFSWLIYVKTNPPEELFPRGDLVNHLFRLLQYRIAVEVKPEFAPKILEIWEKEIKPEPHKSYLLSRITLMTQALVYYQVSLPAKQMVSYLKEMIDIEERYKEIEEIQEVYSVFKGQLEKQMTDKTNFFSILFSLISARRPLYASFLSDLIDAIDSLCPKMRTLLLADFENGIIRSRILIDSVWLAEADIENPDWGRCLQVYDKVIERAIEWNYLHIASAAAKGKAIIYDEYLHDYDAAHNFLQDILSKLGSLPAIEEAQAAIYFHHKHYRDALEIYERILPDWNPSSEFELGFGFLEGYRRSGICAAYLDNWEKAAVFFEEGAKKAQEIDVTEQYIGLYADAGFAQFKAGNVLSCINLLKLALQEFETLPQNDTDVRYFTLKKLLGYLITWLAKRDSDIGFEEPPPGFCSNLDIDKTIMKYPNFPIQYVWLHLAQIEYQFNLGMTIFNQTKDVKDRTLYPFLDLFLSMLEIQYDYKDKIFDSLPQHMNQLAYAYATTHRHRQNEKGIVEKGIYSISIDDLYEFASVDNIVNILVPALLIQVSRDTNIDETLSMWRMNSLELPIEKNINIALDLTESILSKDRREASTVMKIKESKPEERLVAALKIIHNIDTNPSDLFYAHTLVATVIINKDELWKWERHIMTDLVDLFSRQWLEKVKFRAMLKMPTITVPQIEQACNNSETGKKKIGQILLAAHQAVSVGVSPEILQQLRSWVE